MSGQARDDSVVRRRGDVPPAGGVLRALGTASAQPLTDAELIELVQRGERRGAALLYDRYAPLIRRLVLRAFGPGEDAKDLTQDVFVAVIEGLESLRDPGSLRSFVYAVALNTVRMELRRRSRRPRLFFGSRRPAEPWAVPAEHESRQAVHCLYELLAEIDEESRLCFVLRHVEQLSTAAIAEVCGWSLATAKRRVDRASRLVFARARGVPELAGYVPKPDESPVTLDRGKEPRHGRS